jgi:hypothetical protein
MRLVFLFLLTVTLLGATDTSCHVDCPKGYIGGCVKFEEKCDCSCRVNVEDLKNDLLQFLRRSEASQELVERVREYLQGKEHSATMTFTDKKTNKQYTIVLKDFPGN